MNSTQIQLLSLPVSEQDRARDFYVGTLGFDLVADTPWALASTGSRSPQRGRFVSFDDPDGNGIVPQCSTSAGG